ncbi:MAG: leucyl aminopeptidase [Candidatus Promineifilaceae bacterium]
MKLSVQQGDITQTSADTIITNLFNDVTTPGGATGALDAALDGAISDLIANGDATGRWGEVRVIYPRGVIAAKRVLVVGMGKRKGFGLEGVRNVAAFGIRAARIHKAQHVATIVHGAGVCGLDIEAAAQATVIGSLLGLQTFDAQKRKTPPHEIESMTIIEYAQSKIVAIEKGVDSAEKIAPAVKTARDLVFLPPNVANPEYVAATAQAIADNSKLQITVGDRAWAAEHNMGAFLAVALGAGYEPRFIVLEHNADRTDLPTVVLVGKGITFDTGGISLKPSAKMGAMKSDMGGCAAVIGAMQAVAALDLPLRVIGLTPCTENMPDAHAYRPSDVITASNGKTIEIISTDAEGRMALADALVYADRFKPNLVIDLATLTGTAVRAMGEGVAAPFFYTSERVRDQLSFAGRASHERVWPFPFYPEYRRAIDSPVADMKNSGGAMGGLGTSAAFLREFTSYSWVHIDIAGVALTNKATASAYDTHGGTGFGVRLLVEFLRRYTN